MNSRVTLTLSALDWLHCIDGLECRAEAWERTAVYLANGSLTEGEYFVIEECSDSSEATAIAATYRRIAGELRAQLEATR